MQNDRTCGINGGPRQYRCESAMKPKLSRSDGVRSTNKRFNHKITTKLSPNSEVIVNVAVSTLKKLPCWGTRWGRSKTLQAQRVRTVKWIRMKYTRYYTNIRIPYYFWLSSRHLLWLWFAVPDWTKIGFWNTPWILWEFSSQRQWAIFIKGYHWCNNVWLGIIIQHLMWWM